MIKHNWHAEAEAFTCLASSPRLGRSCQTWVSWLGPHSCRVSSAYRCEVKSLEEWSAADPQGPPEYKVELRFKNMNVQCMPVGELTVHWLTFMPISMCERSAKGTSLVTSSQSNTAKLHMSADLLLMSSGLFCKAENKKAAINTTTQSRPDKVHIYHWTTT